MIRMISMKIKTVEMNERGVIVIPQDIRKNLGLEGKSTLILVEKDKEIVLKREKDVAELFMDRDMLRGMT